MMEQAKMQADRLVGVLGQFQSADDLVFAARRMRESGYQERDLGRIGQSLNSLERTYEASVDAAAWRQFILNYAELPVDQHVQAFDEWFGIEGNSVGEADLNAKLHSMPNIVHPHFPRRLTKANGV